MGRTLSPFEELCDGAGALGIQLVDTPRTLSADDATALIGSSPPILAETRALRLDRDDPDTQAIVCIDEEGDVVLAIGNLPIELDDAFHRVLPTLELSSTLRAGAGYRNLSSVFGYHPKKAALKRESCRSTALMREQPDIGDLLVDTANSCGEWMATHLPAVVEHDLDTLQPVLPEWRLSETDGKLWTSGVINRDTAMPYHRDGSNFPTWSAMPVIRSGVRGGHLHLPEYDLVVPCQNGTVIYWWGQRIVHGVTPLRTPSFMLGQPSRPSYRFSIVYYAMRGMKDCATFALDTAAGQARRTEREEQMAAKVRGQA